MLDTGGHTVAFGQVLLLEAPHLGRAQITCQHGFLAAGLHHPAPPGVPGVIHHGGEGDLHAAGARFFGGHPGAFLCQGRVKGAAQAQGDGEDGAVAVDHVHHEQHGNFVGIFGKVDVLHLLHFVGRGEVQDTAQPAQILLRQSELLHGAGDLGTGIHEDIAVVLHELPDFFFQGHLGQELLNICHENPPFKLFEIYFYITALF